MLLFLSTDCPIAAQYTPRLNALFAKYSGAGVEFEAIFPNDMESKPAVQEYMSSRQYAFPFQIDLGAKEAKSLGVKTVPTAIVLSGNGHEIYQGAIDDNPTSTLAHHRYLDEAISAALAGKAPSPSRTSGLGCVIMPSAAPPALGIVNYAAHVRPILQQHCISCHRPGEVAPFSLIGYANARKWAPNIARFTALRQMPPWKAVHGFGDFRNENWLSETEIATLAVWAQAGAPEGKPTNDAVPPPPAEWPLGTPDLVLSAAKPYRLPADGDDVYRNFVIPTHFNEPMYVNGMDVHPGNGKEVHHCIVFVDATHYSDKLAAKSNDGQEGYTSSGGGPGFFPDTSLGGWAPGSAAGHTWPGTAFLLKPGANLVLQVHYHKDGKPESDQTKVALYFAKTKPRHIMQLAWLANPYIHIPAGDPAHQETLDYTAPRDITLYGVMPHMHFLGKSMEATVTYPGGETKPLVLVQDWDFHWQLTYPYKEPLKLPKGSKIHVVATYDNSASNPNNPNSPPKDVGWGEQTTDEMMLLVAAYTVDNPPTGGR